MDIFTLSLAALATMSYSFWVWYSAGDRLYALYKALSTARFAVPMHGSLSQYSYHHRKGEFVIRAGSVTVVWYDGWYGTLRTDGITSYLTISGIMAHMVAVCYSKMYIADAPEFEAMKLPKNTERKSVKTTKRKKR